MRAKAVRGGRRGSMAIDKTWEAINRVRLRKPKTHATDGCYDNRGAPLFFF